MERRIKLRCIIVTLLFAMAVGFFSVRMYGIQVQNENAGLNQASTYTTISRVTAARGEILDRNGNVLVTNRASYNLVFNNYVFSNSSGKNEALRRLVNLCVSQGIAYTEHFPITMEKPYEYTTDQLSDTWRNHFKRFLNYREWDSDMSAPQLMKQLRQAYRLPNDWTDEEVRRVIGLRYELELRSDITNLSNYVLIQDVDSDALSAILELNTPGLTVESSTVREYATKYAAHILGFTGLMDAEQYEYYKELGYAMDASVGQSGFEKAFEEFLHGTDGTKVTTEDSAGNVVSEYYKVQPQAGSNVEVSIDLDLQIAGEEALEQVILKLRENGIGSDKDGMDAEGGAVVAIEVKTGKILACASYPTYDPNSYFSDYNQLLETDFDPLYNRALQATYAPGSVYKMAVAIAACNEGVIDRNTIIEDLGIYTRFESPQPRCMLYTTSGGTQTHGEINVMEALAVSCNYYFYEAGRRTGLSAIDKVAKDLGLGENTGIELYEDTGRRANRETKAEIYANTPDQAGWYDADTVLMSIGQSENRFTPMQLCTYTAALANRGVRYRSTFLNRVISHDYQQLLKETQPEVVSTCQISDEAFTAYNQGMRMAVTQGSVRAYMENYPVAVCAKTGTAEHGSAGSDNASFVCYAPQDDPEIAIAVFVEKGAQGGNLSNVAMAILDAYFNQTTAGNEKITGENTVLP